MVRKVTSTVHFFVGSITSTLCRKATLGGLPAPSLGNDVFLAAYTHYPWGHLKQYPRISWIATSFFLGVLFSLWGRESAGGVACHGSRQQGWLQCLFHVDMAPVVSLTLHAQSQLSSCKRRQYWVRELQAEHLL